MKPRHDFKIWVSRDGQYYWVYYDGNYEALVTSELYRTHAGALIGLNNFKAEMRAYVNRAQIYS